MYDLVMSVSLSYLAIVAVLLSTRCMKIIDLHREYQIVRAREQKVHIKSHAQMLYAEFKSDLLWPISVFRGARGALGWMREK